MENRKTESNNADQGIDWSKKLKEDIAKVGGLESIMEETIEWENSLLRAIQLSSIDDGLENLEAQGLITRRSDKKCMCDYVLTDAGEYSLRDYQKTIKLR